MQRLELSPAQLRAMASGVRTEIIRVLASDGAQSARELAMRMGRPVSGLYHHLAQLEAAGLIRVTGRRATERRPEAIYSLISGQISARKASRTKAGRAALAKTSRLFLTAAARKVSRSLLSDTAVTDGPARNSAVRHIQLRLNKKALAQFNAELDALTEKALTMSTEKGVQLELTLALAPADRQSRTDGSKSVQSARRNGRRKTQPC